MLFQFELIWKVTVTSASSQKYLPSVATVVYNDFYSYQNTYTTSRNSHG